MFVFKGGELTVLTISLPPQCTGHFRIRVGQQRAPYTVHHMHYWWQWNLAPFFTGRGNNLKELDFRLHRKQQHSAAVCVLHVLDALLMDRVLYIINITFWQQNDKRSTIWSTALADICIGWSCGTNGVSLSLQLSFTWQKLQYSSSEIVVFREQFKITHGIKGTKMFWHFHNILLWQIFKWPFKCILFVWDN